MDTAASTAASSHPRLQPKSSHRLVRAILCQCNPCVFGTLQVKTPTFLSNAMPRVPREWRSTLVHENVTYKTYISDRGCSSCTPARCAVVQRDRSPSRWHPWRPCTRLPSSWARYRRSRSTAEHIGWSKFRVGDESLRNQGDNDLVSQMSLLVTTPFFKFVSVLQRSPLSFYYWTNTCLADRRGVINWELL